MAKKLEITEAKLDVGPIEEPEHLDEIMTVVEFINACRGGVYTEDDGHGYFMINDRRTNILARPSFHRQYSTGDIDPELTHVIWFNK